MKIEGLVVEIGGEDRPRYGAVDRLPGIGGHRGAASRGRDDVLRDQGPRRRDPALDAVWRTVMRALEGR